MPDSYPCHAEWTRQFYAPDYDDRSPTILARLDPEETPVDRQPRSTRPFWCSDIELQAHHHHKTCHDQRLRIFETLKRTGAGRGRVLAFAQCRQRVYVYKHRAQEATYKLVRGCCHDRFCPACSRSRAMVIRDNLAHAVEGTQLRLITLTLQSSDRPLSEQLDHLYLSFRRLRAQRLWKARVTKGVAVIELTYNHKTNQWHPHLHVLAAGAYIEKASLASAWLRATGTSYIVDLTFIRHPNAATSYVTKYLTKGALDDPTLPDAALDEAVVALKGRKLIWTIGEWRSVKLLAQPESTDWIFYGDGCAPPEWMPWVATWNALYEAFQRGIGPSFTLPTPSDAEPDLAAAATPPARAAPLAVA